VSASYSLAETEYLEDNWGKVSIIGMAKKLDRSVGAILSKKGRLGLGPFLESGEYITLHQFFLAIGRAGNDEDTINKWLENGFPLKSKKILDYRFKIVYINEFWKWAKEYRTHIDFNKFKENALGAEPPWVKGQRTADVLFSKYKRREWSTKEDITLKNLLKLYKYNYKELSIAISRTEGAIKRRMVGLNIKERPLRESCGCTWSVEQIKIVTELYYKGYRNDVIKNYVDKSGEAIRGKIERLIKDEVITKWK